MEESFFFSSSLKRSFIEKKSERKKKERINSSFLHFLLAPQTDTQHARNHNIVSRTSGDGSSVYLIQHVMYAEARRREDESALFPFKKKKKKKELSPGAVRLSFAGAHTNPPCLVGGTRKTKKKKKKKGQQVRMTMDPK